MEKNKKSLSFNTFAMQNVQSVENKCHSVP